MITAIAYVRVSTEEQAAEGVSIDAQVAAVRAYATLRGLELVDVVIDAGVSAGKPLADRVGGAVVGIDPGTVDEGTVFQQGGILELHVHGP